MFKVSIQDLETGEVSGEFVFEHVEITQSRGFRRLDPDDGGPQPPQMVDTGAAVALIKCWTGEAIGMVKYEDFVNFTDDTGGAPDVPDDGS